MRTQKIRETVVFEEIPSVVLRKMGINDGKSSGGVDKDIGSCRQGSDSRCSGGGGDDGGCGSGGEDFYVREVYIRN